MIALGHDYQITMIVDEVDDLLKWITRNISPIIYGVHLPRHRRMKQRQLTGTGWYLHLLGPDPLNAQYQISGWISDPDKALLFKMCFSNMMITSR